MFYIICYFKRHPVTGLIRTIAHPATCDDFQTALQMQTDVGTEMKSPAWIIEAEKPAITPQLKLVEPSE